jgi:ubiquinone/menaquinone biosynthesis C-methylase UbiE
MTGFLGGPLARLILDRYKWTDMTGDNYLGKSKLEMTLGSEVWSKIKGKTVLDFGCGDGAEVVEIAERGVTKRVGLDIDPSLLRRARARAAAAGVSERCEFRDSFTGGRST